MTDRDTQVLGAARGLQRRHEVQVRALQAAQLAAGGGFIGGPGGRPLAEGAEAVVCGLDALSLLLCEATPPLEEVLAALLELAWVAVHAMAATIRVLRAGALAGGTWAAPDPAEASTARVCVQAYRVYLRLADDGARLLRRVLRLGWGAEVPRALLELGLDRQLDALEERELAVRAAAPAAVAGLSGSLGLGLRSFPAPWEAPPEPA